MAGAKEVLIHYGFRATILLAMWAVRRLIHQRGSTRAKSQGQKAQPSTNNTKRVKFKIIRDPASEYHASNPRCDTGLTMCQQV